MGFSSIFVFFAFILVFLVGLKSYGLFEVWVRRETFSRGKRLARVDGSLFEFFLVRVCFREEEGIVEVGRF